MPGVRSVFIGEAMQKKSKYHFCWLVHFTHKLALQSFHEHQSFNELLKKKLTPLVCDLLTVDYKENI